MDGHAICAERQDWLVVKLFDDSVLTELAAIADEARQMLQGVGSRFDYHVCKKLCDLR